MDNELLSLLKKREQDAKKEGVMALIAGGVAEALSGDTGGEIAQYGSALAKDRFDRQESLQDMELKTRAATSKADARSMKKRFQQSAYEDEQGNIKLGTFDTFTGKFSNEGNRIKGLAPAITRDPRTEELARITKGRAGEKAIAIESEGVPQGRFNVKQEKDVKQLQDRFSKDKVVIANRTSSDMSTRALELLASGNPVSDQGLKTIFPRIFGEVGNLAAAEQERFAGSPEGLRRYERLKSRWIEGKISEEDRSDMIEVARMMRSYANRRLADLSNRYARANSRITGIKASELQRALSPMSAASRANRKEVSKITSKKGKVQDQVIEKFYKGRKRKFKKNSKGQWEMF